MTALIIFAILILLAIVIVQIGKVTELATRIRGEEEIELRNNRAQGRWLLLFAVAFLVFCFWSAGYFKNWMMGYGPHTSASEHGAILDNLFNVTVVITGIVFVITQFLLFYFGWKYHARKGQKATFIAHNNTLEVVWSAIPAVVMTLLVVKGLIAWNEVMADVGPDEEYMEIEATGYQFAWHIRYPGADGALGKRNYRLISGINPLGQDWTDDKNLDDLHPQEIVLPVGKKVRVRITSRDVLHNFYLPHFRVKMDAVPGIPTYFVFTPMTTTQEYREELSNYPEYNIENEDGNKLWEVYNYELACAELCGSGHYSMRRIVRIVSQEEYDAWIAGQQPYYMSSIRNTDSDPRKGDVLDIEVNQWREDLLTDVESALASTSEAEKIITLEHIDFAPGSSTLTEGSRYIIEILAGILKRYPNMQIEVSGHTDNTGDPAMNQELSLERAGVVVTRLNEEGISADRLQAAGYGDTRPIGDNETEAGREQNRRTEFKIIDQ